MTILIQEMHSLGSPRGEDKWFPPEINSYDDVERILLNAKEEKDMHYDSREDDVNETAEGSGDLTNRSNVIMHRKWPMREFAERYYNKQRMSTNKRKQQVI